MYFFLRVCITIIIVYMDVKIICVSAPCVFSHILALASYPYGESLSKLPCASIFYVDKQKALPLVSLGVTDVWFSVRGS